MFEQLNNSAVTEWLNGWVWGFPSAEIFHIFMTGGFFGALAALDLRLLGVYPRLPVSQLLAFVFPLLRWLFAGVLVSGALLFLFMPLEYSHNPAFLTKLALIVVGGLNALFMHQVLMREMAGWNVSGSTPAAVKVSALLSLAVWMGCLACGRLIAYFYGAHGA